MGGQAVGRMQILLSNYKRKKKEKKKNTPTRRIRGFQRLEDGSSDLGTMGVLKKFEYAFGNLSLQAGIS